METLRKLKRRLKRRGMILATYEPPLEYNKDINHLSQRNLKIEVLLTSGVRRFLTFKRLRRKIFLLLILALTIPNILLAESPKVLFSPNGGCQEAIIQEISKAQKTIDIAMYYLTTREIAQELVKAKEKGVTIRIFLDQSQEHASYSKSRYLMKKGIDVRFYVGSGLMHNKFAILDNKVLITGSFNWTATANKENQENMLIMTDKDLIGQYVKRFDLLWKYGRKSEINLEEGGEE